MASEHPSPVSGEQHERAVEAAHWKLGGVICDFNEDTGRYEPLSTVRGYRGPDEEGIVAAMIARYFASLAERGVRLVDLREVVEELRSRGHLHSAAALERRFGGHEGSEHE